MVFANLTAMCFESCDRYYCEFEREDSLAATQPSMKNDDSDRQLAIFAHYGDRSVAGGNHCQSSLGCHVASILINDPRCLFGIVYPVHSMVNSYCLTVTIASYVQN